MNGGQVLTKLSLKPSSYGRRGLAESGHCGRRRSAASRLRLRGWLSSILRRYSIDMRLLTLNIHHGGGTRGDRLVDFLLKQAADTIVLTEYRANTTGERVKSRLSAHGYRHQAASSTAPKQNGLCILSRLPFAKVEIDCDTGADRHRLLALRFEGLLVGGVYLPQKKAKRAVFETLRRNLLPQLGKLGVVLGDFNTGRPFEDEAGKTFYSADCFDELLSAGLVDSWRSRNPTDREFSWYSRSNNGFRIDHALSTPGFDASIQSIQYIHESRTSGITDHSALLLHSDASQFAQRSS